MRLAGKLAVVTGAARGIGRAIAVSFAAEGADLVLVDVADDIAECPYPLGTWAQLCATAEMCREHAVTAQVHWLDVRDAEHAPHVVAGILDRFGRIDILVNNAGLAATSGRPVHEMTEDEWRLMIDVNLGGPWRLMRLIAPDMLRQRAGSMINIAATAGLVGYRRLVGYVTTKHGLIGLTRAAALDYARYGVRVNAVCPSAVWDEPELDGRVLGEVARILGMTPDEYERILVADQPTNRLVAAADVARACLWLASDESRDITGSTVVIDGGFTAR